MKFQNIQTFIILFLALYIMIISIINESNNNSDGRDYYIKKYMSENATDKYTNVTGLYMPDSGYFVSTKGRVWNDIVDTDTHEQCHVLIDENYNHFCIDYGVGEKHK